MKSRKETLVVLAILVLGIVTLLPAVAAADGAQPRTPPTLSSSQVQGQQQQSLPGRYRQQGAYRGSERANQPPWQPSYHYQNKYYQVKPPTSFTGNLSRSTYDFSAGGAFYNFVPPTGYAYQVPVQYVEPPPAPPPPVTQVYVVQAPPPAPAAVPTPTPAPPPPAAPEPPRSKEPGLVDVSVHPEDAKVYLDDRLLGDGRSLVERGPLKLPPGVYILEVEHPSYEAQRLIFGITPEETTQVTIDLTSDHRGRRSQVRTGDDLF